MSTPPITTQVLAWYLRSEWPTIRQMSADKSGMAVSFDDWRRNAQEAAEIQASKGLTVVRAHIAPSELAAFCARNRVKVDGNARSRLAMELLPLILSGKRTECPIT